MYFLALPLPIHWALKQTFSDGYGVELKYLSDKRGDSFNVTF